MVLLDPDTAQLLIRIRIRNNNKKSAGCAGGGQDDPNDVGWGQEADWLHGLTSGLMARGLEARDLGLYHPPCPLLVCFHH